MRERSRNELFVAVFLAERMQNSFLIQQMYTEHLLCGRFCTGFGATAMDNINTVVSPWGLGGRMWEIEDALITQMITLLQF